MLASPDGVVIATGGGIVSNAAAWAMLRAGTRTVWLKARPDEYLARVLKQGDRRPMEKHPEALTALKALLAAREPEYRKAELTVDTTNTEAEQVSRRVVAWIEKAEAPDARAG